MKRSEPSLKELILAQVVTGRLQDAALCYERLAQEGQLDRHSLQASYQHILFFNKAKRCKQSNNQAITNKLYYLLWPDYYFVSSMHNADDRGHVSIPFTLPNIS